MKTRQLLALSLLVGLLLVPMAATADHHETGPKPLTWLSYVQSQTGKSMPLTQHLAEDGAKIYDGLMADGHILTWGVGMPVNHRAGDDWNIMEWVTFRDWAAVDAFMQAFMGMQMSKSPEDAMAEQEDVALRWSSRGPTTTRSCATWWSMPSDGPPPGYYAMTFVPAKPGQEKALTEALGGQRPADDGGAADGRHHRRLRSGRGRGARRLGLELRLLDRHAEPGGPDAINAAMEADAMERGEEAQMAMMKGFYEAVDFSAHDDRIIMVVHYGGGSAGDGSE